MALPLKIPTGIAKRGACLSRTVNQNHQKRARQAISAIGLNGRATPIPGSVVDNLASLPNTTRELSLAIVAAVVGAYGGDGHPLGPWQLAVALVLANTGALPPKYISATPDTSHDRVVGLNLLGVDTSATEAEAVQEFGLTLCGLMTSLLLSTELVDE